MTFPFRYYLMIDKHDKLSLETYIKSITYKEIILW
jgi:hypothetical protein